MDIVLILFQCHADDSHIDFQVNTLGLQTVMQDVTRNVAHLHRLLDSLGNGLDGLFVDYLLGRLLVFHNDSEDGKEEPQQCQAEEHDAHGHDRHGQAVGVFTLELVNLRLADGRVVRDARSHAVGRLHFPVGSISVVGNAGKRLVSLHGGNPDGVDELCGIAVVETNPYGLTRCHVGGEVQGTQMGLTV